MSFNWNSVKTDPADFRWARVSVRHRCPVCGKPDWCAIREDGNLVRCMRVPSDRPARRGGWMHRVDEGAVDPSMIVDSGPPINAELAYAQMFRDHDPIRFHDMCREIGIDARHVAEIGGLYSPFYRALAWPTYRHGGVMTGIRVRYKWGAKRSVIGSRAGVFARHDNDYDTRKPLLVVEGPTDTAASHQLGLQAIGRPGCASYVDLVGEYASHFDDVVVAADDDAPGRQGAAQLVADLKDEFGVAARFAVCPCGDMREWLRSGATRDDARSWING